MIDGPTPDPDRIERVAGPVVVVRREWRPVGEHAPSGRCNGTSAAAVGT